MTKFDEYSKNIGLFMCVCLCVIQESFVVINISFPQKKIKKNKKKINCLAIEFHKEEDKSIQNIILANYIENMVCIIFDFLKNGKKMIQFISFFLKMKKITQLLSPFFSSGEHVCRNSQCYSFFSLLFKIKEKLNLIEFFSIFCMIFTREFIYLLSPGKHSVYKPFHHHIFLSFKCIIIIIINLFHKKNHHNYSPSILTIRNNANPNIIITSTPL